MIWTFYFYSLRKLWIKWPPLVVSILFLMMLPLHAEINIEIPTPYSDDDYCDLDCRWCANGHRLFWCSIKRCDLEVLNKVIDHLDSGSIAYEDLWYHDGSMTEIIMAIFYKCEPAISLILKRMHVNINQQISNGVTALLYAASQGEADIARILLNHGADVNSVLSDGATPLVLSIQANSTSVYQLLIKSGSDYSVAFNTMAMDMFAAKYANSVVLEDLLNKLGFDDWKCYLCMALVNNNYHVADYLIKRGIDVNQLFSENHNALSVLSDFGNTEAMKFLLGRGAGVNVRVEHGQTSLIRAVLRDKPDSVEVLLGAGADVYAEDDAGYTAYDYALKKKYHDLAAMIVWDQHYLCLFPIWSDSFFALSSSIIVQCYKYSVKKNAGILADISYQILGGSLPHVMLLGGGFLLGITYQCLRGGGKVEVEVDDRNPDRQKPLPRKKKPREKKAKIADFTGSKRSFIDSNGEKSSSLTMFDVDRANREKQEAQNRKRRAADAGQRRQFMSDLKEILNTDRPWGLIDTLVGKYEKSVIIRILTENANAAEMFADAVKKAQYYATPENLKPFKKFFHQDKEAQLF